MPKKPGTPSRRALVVASSASDFPSGSEATPEATPPTSKIGRPRAPEGTALRALSVFLGDDHYMMLDRLARDAGLQRSPWLRAMLVREYYRTYEDGDEYLRAQRKTT